ncbi:hypothetical protein KUH03_40420 [Sphingobacterium sp. E70]|uniref:hypothetical protein n=1 Tax=Sphingobacterium sp. E70 TaxID=2853439 RepID=UPI00211BEACF|nr:hypothetical protein [Sphingobacterium sp. E70]ULT25058.1 hypothetical protein KUH03_40420 [Sphingobacterium sp. E70]
MANSRLYARASLSKFTFLNGRENIVIIWSALVGFGVALGIHAQKDKCDNINLNITTKTKE